MAVQESQVQISSQVTARSLSLAQAREALGVSRRTLYYWIKRGRLRTLRTSMGSQRVLADSVKSSFLQRKERAADTGLDDFCTDACGASPTEE